MTRPDIDAIKARYEAATEGPWENRGHGVVHRENNGPTAYESPIAYIREGADTEFIAAARSDVPALLAYIETLEARINAVRALWPGGEPPCMYTCIHVDCAVLNALEGDQK